MEQILSENLFRLRKARGFRTQEAMAAAIGIPFRTYQDVERGISWPQKRTIEAIAKALEVSESELFLDGALVQSPPTIHALTQIIEQQENRLKERENTITLEAILNRLGKHARRIVEQTIKDDLGIKDLKELVQNSDRQIDDRT